jgi:magnesium-transporting ATPase (P-type)
VSSGLQATPAWHALPADAVLARLEVDPGTGLPAADARVRRARQGPNRLPEERRESAFVRFAKQFHNILIYILIAVAVITAFLGKWIDTGVILAVVLANAPGVSCRRRRRLSGSRPRYTATASALPCAPEAGVSGRAPR